jgi:hypothetical protein
VDFRPQAADLLQAESLNRSGSAIHDPRSAVRDPQPDRGLKPDAGSVAPDHARRLASLAGATLIGVVVLLWVGSLSEWLDLWDELASWAVAGLLAAVIAATMPELKAVRRSVFGELGGGTR